MRKWHRWTMTVFGVLMLYWVTSGLIMAIYDATDSHQVWAIEGAGPGARLNDSLAGAMPIPPPSTLAPGIATALRAVSDMPIAAVDLRMRGFDVRVQFSEASGRHTDLRRFYADTGRPMPDIVADGDPNAPVPGFVSFRTSLKSWHRGNIVGLFGQFVGLLTGIALIVIAITGIVTYLKLWTARRSRGKGEFFWSSRDSLWRRLHRWSSIVSSVFILNIAVSGCILAYGELQLRVFLNHHIGVPPYPRPEPLPQVSAAVLPADINGLLEKTYQAALSANPKARILDIALVERGDGVPRGLVTLDGSIPKTYAYNATTGQPAQDWTEGGVQVGTGYFFDWHQVVKRIHRGDIIGDFSGRYIDMAAGFVLLYLIVSSFVMYVQLMKGRLRMGRRNLFWK